MNWRPIIGILVNTEIWLFFILNLVCLFCMWRGRMIMNKENPAYLITVFNILCDTCQLIIHVLYVGPSIFMGSWIFGDQGAVGVTIAATWFLGLWFFGSYIQILMAVNRLCVVFFPGIHIFNHTRILILIALFFLMSLSMVLYSQIISPCCRYSYLNVENITETFSTKYVNFPIDVVTTLICVISYCALFFYVWRMKQGDTGNRRREFRLCIQFVIIFLAYNVTWSTFFCFPMLGLTIPEAYTVTTVVFMANCGTNAVIYLTMNKEIKFQLKKRMGKVSSSQVNNSLTRTIT